MTVSTPRIGYYESLCSALILDEFIHQTTGHAAWNALLSDIEGETKSYRIRDFINTVFALRDPRLKKDAKKILVKL